MRKITGRFRLGLALVLALFLLSSPLSLKADVTDSGVTAKVGEAVIKLLNPSGMIHVDGLDANADAALKMILPGGGAQLLAVYAEPVAWAGFKKGLGPFGPQDLLNYYSIIITPPALVGEVISLERFAGLKENHVRPMTEEIRAEILDEQPRYLTYQLVAKGLDDVVLFNQVTTTILVEGKVLNLTTVSRADNQFKDQFPKSALDWRDAYLEKTKP